MSKLKNKLTELTETTKPELDLLSTCEITDETVIEIQKPLVMIDNRKYLMKGDICIVSGEKKAGKSHVIRRIMMTTLMPNIPVDFDSFRIRSDYSPNWLVYIDTEQHESKTKQTAQYCYKRAGYDKKPENFKVFNIRDLEPEERANEIIKYITKNGKNIHLMVIDGVSDLIDSINDEVLSKKLANTFLKNKENQISYIMAIHERKGGGGGLGWLGQVLEKKAGGGIRVEKDYKTDIHSLHCSFLRDDGNFKPIEFKWNDSINDFEMLSEFEMIDLRQKTKAEKDQQKTTDLKLELRKIFGGAKTLPKTKFYEILQNTNPEMSEKTRYRTVADAKKLNLILDTIKDFTINFELQ